MSPLRSERAPGRPYSGDVDDSTERRQGGAAAAAARPVRITLIGKPGCHLCEDARAVVARVAAETGVAWEERSILDDPALAERYAEEIPVTLVDGRQHDYWRVDEGRLRAALAAPPPT